MLLAVFGHKVNVVADSGVGRQIPFVPFDPSACSLLFFVALTYAGCTMREGESTVPMRTQQAGPLRV